MEATVNEFVQKSADELDKIYREHFNPPQIPELHPQKVDVFEQVSIFDCSYTSYASNSTGA